MKPIKYEKWLAELQAEIGLLDGEPVAPLERLKHTLTLTRGQINAMRDEVISEGFSSAEAEIHFFKKIKPGFYALQIYEVDFYSLIANTPVGTTEMIRSYYEQELLYLFRFFRTHAFHYQYYRTGARELDGQYFTREGKPGDIPVLEIVDPWPGFSSPLDYLFAKFIAYERLQNYLIDQLTVLYAGVKQLEKNAKQTPKLRWTGEAINLVEVAYGLWLTGQINDGNVTITDLVLWLEQKFSVKIGVPSRRWNEISGRTHSDPAKFLDRMRAAIHERVNEELGVRERKRKARRK
ncbi:MAG TPA: RteC domain-containing protein [Mucilaginibacter sp.]|nr:RteC domain-containing protein [Mucilaginibacter sp.]